MQTRIKMFTSGFCLLAVSFETDQEKKSLLSSIYNTSALKIMNCFSWNCQHYADNA